MFKKYKDLFLKMDYKITYEDDNITIIILNTNHAIRVSIENKILLDCDMGLRYRIPEKTYIIFNNENSIIYNYAYLDTFIHDVKNNIEIDLNDYRNDNIYFDKAFVYTESDHVEMVLHQPHDITYIKSPSLNVILTALTTYMFNRWNMMRLCSGSGAKFEHPWLETDGVYMQMTYGPKYGARTENEIIIDLYENHKEEYVNHLYSYYFDLGHGDSKSINEKCIEMMYADIEASSHYFINPSDEVKMMYRFLKE